MRAIVVVLLACVSCGLAQYYPPLWNVPSQEIDSSEHGGPPGPRPTTCPCGWANKGKARIIGGKETLANEYPWAVLLALRNGNRPFCGGSIITNHHVLTAAHCPNSVPNQPLVVIAGDHDNTRESDTPHKKVINVRQIIMHENYPRLQHYDIALLVLEQSVSYTTQIGPVCMPHMPLKLDNQYLKVVGWGKTSPYGNVSPVLKKVNVRAISLEVCRNYAQIEYNDRRQICTFSKMKGFGQGDSGGPVVWLNKNTNRYTLVGLPSFVYLYQDINRSPDVATDVASFLPWINSKIKATMPSANVCTAA